MSEKNFKMELEDFILSSNNGIIGIHDKLIDFDFVKIDIPSI